MCSIIQSVSGIILAGLASYGWKSFSIDPSAHLQTEVITTLRNQLERCVPCPAGDTTAAGSQIFSAFAIGLLFGSLFTAVLPLVLKFYGDRAQSGGQVQESTDALALEDERGPRWSLSGGSTSRVLRRR